jgi:hypothetical protein
MKIKHIYTVERVFDCHEEEAEDEIAFCKGAISDESGEYLYSGPHSKEKIYVDFYKSVDEVKWEKID